MIKLNLGLLKKARRNKKLTTQKVGELIGRDRTTIWRFETGKTDIPTKILCQLLNIYCVTPRDVFTIVQGDKDDSI